MVSDSSFLISDFLFHTSVRSCPRSPFHGAMCILGREGRKEGGKEGRRKEKERERKTGYKTIGHKPLIQAKQRGLSPQSTHCTSTR